MSALIQLEKQKIQFLFSSLLAALSLNNNLCFFFKLFNF